jgi:hypothetical protein
MTEREELIEYAKAFYCDMIPYDDPDYEKYLQEISDLYADRMLGVVPWPDMGEECENDVIDDDDLPF